MIKVYDANGKEQTLKWALDKYNVKFTIVAKSRDHWEVVALYEVIGPASMTVRVVPGYVAPEVNMVPIVFAWPDGKVQQFTDANGQSGFGMGVGAYYHPDRGETGPHWVYVNTTHPTDIVEGLGMIGKTNHAHLEPTFQFVKGEVEPSPPDCEEYFSALEKIREIIDGISPR